MKPAVTVREATPADNEAILALELETTLVLGEVEDVFDRAPDAFAYCRVQDGCRLTVGELDGRIVGLLAGVMFNPILGGEQRWLVYIHRARVHPESQGRGVGIALSTDMFRWCAEQGGSGPCYAIAPDNTPSLAFVQRGGGRWPRDVSFVDIHVDDARAVPSETLSESHWPAAVELINATHSGEDFFEPLTVETLRSRLSRDAAYTPASLRGVFAGGTLVAVAGLCDKGRYSERIRIDRASGKRAGVRAAQVVDWGFAPGHTDTLGVLLQSLASEAKDLGRTVLTICEPRPGSISPTLPHPRSAVALFTPSLAVPAAVDGLFFDLLTL